MLEIKNKKFYWIKLRVDFFEQETIDFLLSQKDGSQYVALYLKLCFMTANTGGRLVTKLGNIEVPYDVEKIARDTKFFSADTIRAALRQFKDLGLIVVSDDNVLQIADYEKMVGNSKTDEYKKAQNAERQRRFRSKKKKETVKNNVTSNVTVTRYGALLRNTESRDKEYRDKEMTDLSVCHKEKRDRTDSFIKPTLEDVQKFIQEKKLNVDAEKFWNHYESMEWHTGSDPIRDWKGLLKRWSRTQNSDVVGTSSAVTLDDKFYCKPNMQSKEELNAETLKLQEALKNGVL